MLWDFFHWDLLKKHAKIVALKKLQFVSLMSTLSASTLQFGSHLVHRTVSLTSWCVSPAGCEWGGDGPLSLMEVIYNMFSDFVRVCYKGCSALCVCVCFCVFVYLSKLGLNRKTKTVWFVWIFAVCAAECLASALHFQNHWWWLKHNIWRYLW